MAVFLPVSTHAVKQPLSQSYRLFQVPAMFFLPLYSLPASLSSFITLEWVCYLFQPTTLAGTFGSSGIIP